jgi:hypothetical protein
MAPRSCWNANRQELGRGLFTEKFRDVPEHLLEVAAVPGR